MRNKFYHFNKKMKKFNLTITNYCKTLKARFWIINKSLNQKILNNRIQQLKINNFVQNWRNLFKIMKNLKKKWKFHSSNMYFYSL